MDPVALGILGAALSGLIAAISYLAKTRHERRRTTRAVLYYLLELHHLVSRIHYGLKHFPEDYIAQCKRAMASKGLVLSDADAAKIDGDLRQVLHAFALAEMHGLSITIAEPLDKALAELSREDPVLAFRLRGKDQLMMLSRKLEATAAAITTPEQPAPSVPFSQRYAPVGNFVRQATVGELKAAIVATAWRCDLLTHLRVRLLLRSAARAQASGELKQLTADLVEDLVGQLVSEGRPISPSSELQTVKI